MVGSEAIDSVLLPFDALALLGAGPQGAAAIRNYGVATRNFEQGFSELMDRLAAESRAEAETEATLSRVIAATAARAHSWVSLRSECPEIAPAILLLSDEVVLIAVLHGPVVEYVIGELELMTRTIRGALRMDGHAVVRVTLFDADERIVDARLCEGTVEVAAKVPERLARLEQRILAAPSLETVSEAVIEEAVLNRLGRVGSVAER